MNLEIVSDLHIDQWDPKFNISNPCGEVKNSPLKWNLSDNILVIAGDISDDLDRTCKYLNELSNYYSTILFVDGNHEHVNHYPCLYSNEEILKKINDYGNENVKYLAKETYIKDNIAYLGYCGWWDYEKLDPEEIKRCMVYFDEWINYMDRQQSLEFISNVFQRAKEEGEKLQQRIEELQKNEEVKEIVVVTHCVPISNLTDEGRLGTEHNQKFQEILNKKYTKLKKWIFGHTHQHYNQNINGVQFLANARGRPEDFNRVNYSILKSKL